MGFNAGPMRYGYRKKRGICDDADSEGYAVQEKLSGQTAGVLLREEKSVERIAGSEKAEDQRGKAKSRQGAGSAEP